MGAVLKKMRQNKTGFEVPTVEEIKIFMIEKKGWPDEFCQWYAEKFWNNYEACGWKLSNGLAMKSWPAAFSNNWQDLKYEETRIKLKECMKNKPAIVKSMNGNDRLNDLLLRFRINFETVTDLSLIRAYDYMKEHKLIKLTPEEIRHIKAAYGDNVEKGKAACVKIQFTNMVNHGRRF